MYRRNESSFGASKMPVSVKETRDLSCSYSFADYKNVYSTLMLRVTHMDYRATHFSWRYNRRRRCFAKQKTVPGRVTSVLVLHYYGVAY